MGVNQMKRISGGVTAPAGFIAGGMHCGIRKNRTKKDLALILAQRPCAAAAVYTQNTVKGAPLLVTQKRMEKGLAQAVIVNSGNANTCNADGMEKAEAMCALAAEALKLPKELVFVASTGVIGQTLPLEPIAAGIPLLVKRLSVNGSSDAAEAILTTDTFQKEVAVEITVGGKTGRIGGIAKGSGMIHPNMATMLAFLTTDIHIAVPMLQKALCEITEKTFNMLSIDGDTSTNDMVSIMSSGLAGNEEITSEGADFEIFMEALLQLCTELCRLLARDGEGATKLLSCRVAGGATRAQAVAAAKAVIGSSLTKSAMFGADANWGRVLCAIGYSGGEIDPSGVDVSFISKNGRIDVCKGGVGIFFDEQKAKEVLLDDEIEIAVELHAGDETATAWGCDLTYDYVKINGDYRT